MSGKGSSKPLFPANNAPALLLIVNCKVGQMWKMQDKIIFY